LRHRVVLPLALTALAMWTLVLSYEARNARPGD
jgi:hypothetical protein